MFRKTLSTINNNIKATEYQLAFSSENISEAIDTLKKFDGIIITLIVEKYISKLGERLNDCKR